MAVANTITYYHNNCIIVDGPGVYVIRTLAYYSKAVITAAKSFIVQALVSFHFLTISSEQKGLR